MPVDRPFRSLQSPSPGSLRSSDGPRERLSALGPGALSDAELLALVLRTGAGRRDALGIARALLSRFEGLAGLAAEDAPALCCEHGLGPAKAASLLGAFEIGRRLAARRLEPGDRIRTPADVHRHFHARLRDARQECFVALLLDGRHRVQGEITVSTGTLTASLVHPREVFGPAVRRAAAALVLVHNHPSGDPAPSAEDRQVTERLVAAGELLGIRVLDHVVVAERGYYSFSEAGDLD
jgi:DNA repair protein RadC